MVTVPASKRYTCDEPARALTLHDVARLLRVLNEPTVRAVLRLMLIGPVEQRGLWEPSLTSLSRSCGIGPAVTAHAAERLHQAGWVHRRRTTDDQLLRLRADDLHRCVPGLLEQVAPVLLDPAASRAVVPARR